MLEYFVRMHNPLKEMEDTFLDGPSKGLQEQEEWMVEFRLRLECAPSTRLSDVSPRRTRVSLASISFRGTPHVFLDI